MLRGGPHGPGPEHARIKTFWSFFGCFEGQGWTILLHRGHEGWPKVGHSAVGRILTLVKSQDKI